MTEKASEYDRETHTAHHNHTQQANIWHREEEPQSTDCNLDIKKTVKAKQPGLSCSSR